MGGGGRELQPGCHRTPSFPVKYLSWTSSAMFLTDAIQGLGHFGFTFPPNSHGSPKRALKGKSICACAKDACHNIGKVVIQNLDNCLACEFCQIWHMILAV